MKWRKGLAAAVGFLLFHQTASCGVTNLVQQTMKTKQSSTYVGEDSHKVPHSSERTIDGDPSKCAHTKKEAGSWWRIDLGGLFQVSCIYINNDKNKYNLTGSQIYIGNSTEGNGTVNSLCVNVTLSLQKDSGNLSCQSPIWGRYVSVNMKKKEFLVLCEVKIYGTNRGRWKLVKESKPWDEALYYCRDRDMDLVSVLDADAQTFVGLEAQKAQTPHVWLGLHYTCTLGFWFWVADHHLNVTYWHPDHRANTSACDTSAAMAKDKPHYWSTKSDHDAFNFICE